MLITVSLILDFSLCALVAMQGMVPISAAASEGEFAASLAPFPQLFPPVPDGFSAPGPWIPTLLPVPEMSKDLKVSKEGFSPCAEPSAAIPVPGGMQVVDSSLWLLQGLQIQGEKKYSKRWNPGTNEIRKNLAVYMNGARITLLAKMIRPRSLSIHLLLFSASNKHSKG